MSFHTAPIQRLLPFHLALKNLIKNRRQWNFEKLPLVAPIFRAVSLAVDWTKDKFRNPHWARRVRLPESRRFYEVTPMLYRSVQPTPQAYSSYEKFGIKTVVNLSDESDDREMLKNSSMRLIEVHMKTRRITDEHVIAVLKIIKNNSEPMLVHCQRGAERTGVIMAMYRIIFQNWDKERAIDEMVNGGYYFNKRKANIPEYVRNADIEYLKKEIFS